MILAIHADNQIQTRPACRYSGGNWRAWCYSEKQAVCNYSPGCPRTTDANSRCVCLKSLTHGKRISLEQAFPATHTLAIVEGDQPGNERIGNAAGVFYHQTNVSYRRIL